MAGAGAESFWRLHLLYRGGAKTGGKGGVLAGPSFNRSDQSPLRLSLIPPESQLWDPSDYGLS